MNMNLKEIVQWMMQQGYMVQIKSNYKVTAKFNKVITGKETGLMMLGNRPVVMENEPPSTLVPVHKVTDWTTAYLNFIKEAEVPTRGTGRDGGYDLNKYSDPAMKIFRKAIESGVKYAILVKSTMLYYKTRKSYQLTIGRYIEDGLWRSDYEALMASAEDGTLTEHIQTNIDDTTEFSRYKRV